MKKQNWYFEQDAFSGGLSMGYKVKKRLLKKKTEFQKIEIYESETFGRCLFLDGIAQTSERDEFIYHEMIVHVPLFSHPNPKRVAIIGGGDGGVLREVNKHLVNEVHLVEIDDEVIKASIKWLPKISNGSFNDSRLCLHVEDGIKFIKDIQDKFDVIIVDSSDPIGPARDLFSLDFYRDINNALAEGGIVVYQSGSIFLQPEEVVTVVERNRLIFPWVNPYLIDVPIYCGGCLSLTLASKSDKINNVNQGNIAEKFDGLNLKTKYYTPKNHLSSFVLPRFLEERLTSS